jgi:hypothetical protein
MQKVSGAQVSKNVKKMVGCDNCNYMKLHDKATTPVLHMTGETCPKCHTTKSIRVFDSTAEFQRAQELKILNAQGFISDLKYQVRFDLHVPDFETGKPKKLYTYVTDFTYTEPSKDDPSLSDFIVEDVKGQVVTETAAIKMRHMEIEYGIPIRIVQR